MLSYIALGFFSLAALSGLFIGLKQMSFKPMSSTAGVMHGTLGLAGFALVLSEGVLEGFPPKKALFCVLFSIVAVLGAIMFLLRTKDRPPPLFLVLLHGMIAVGALSVLVFSTFGF